jgi:hypothetical protein
MLKHALYSWAIALCPFCFLLVCGVCVWVYVWVHVCGVCVCVCVCVCGCDEWENCENGYTTIFQISVNQASTKVEGCPNKTEQIFKGCRVPTLQAACTGEHRRCHFSVNQTLAHVVFCRRRVLNGNQISTIASGTFSELTALLWLYGAGLWAWVVSVACC